MVSWEADLQETKGKAHGGSQLAPGVVQPKGLQLSSAGSSCRWHTYTTLLSQNLSYGNSEFKNYYGIQEPFLKK